MSLLGSLFKTSPTPDTQIKTPLDLVTYAAGLASNPVEIDSYLDNVRRITAIRSVDQLSPADEQVLLSVYLQIEQYLTTKDPIRTYTQEELRTRISPGLSTKLTNYAEKETTNV